jgi:uncharacterized protein
VRQHNPAAPPILRLTRLRYYLARGFKFHRALWMTDFRRQLLVTIGVAAACCALAAPAHAQFRDFFRGWSGGGGGYYQNPSYDPYSPFRQQQPVEATKPPPPRKVETPPTETVWVIGDAIGEWLAYGLEETMADTPQVGIVRKIKPWSGLVRYDVRPDAPDWSQAVKDIPASEKPSAIVVMLGINDRLPLRERAQEKDKEKDKDKADKEKSDKDKQAEKDNKDTKPTSGPDIATNTDNEQPAAAPEPQRRLPPGAAYEFHTDRWGELYEKRIDEMIAALRSKGVPVLWVGLPSVRGTKSTSDMSYLDELFRARAEKAGIVYVDIWDGFVDDKGNYTQQGPDFEGQIRRLRTYDGVNFTKYGAEKLAHYVEKELRRVLANPLIPVALPGPEEQPKGPAAGTRPVIGPVVPLGALDKNDGNELLGANAPAQRDPDPIAARVLSRGEAAPPQAGRADDFAWPRADANAGGTVDIMPAPAASPAPAKGAGGKTDPKAGAKPDAKADASKNAKPAPAVTPNVPAGQPQNPRRTELDGAPRPPAPVGR